MSRLVRIVVLLLVFTAYGQQTSLENQLKTSTGFERLEILTRLSKDLASSNEKKSRRYAKQAFVIVNNILESDDEFTLKEQKLLVNGLLVYGQSQYIRKNYLDAKGVMEEANALAEDIDFAEGSAIADRTIQQVDSLIAAGVIKDNFLNRTLSDISLNKTLRNSTNNINAGIAIKAAKVFENKGDTLAAIEQYLKAAKTLKANGEFDKAAELETKIATLRQIQLMERISKLETDDIRIIDSTVLPLITPSVLADRQEEITDLEQRAAQLEDAEDYKQALTYYKEYIALRQRWERDSVTKQAEQSRAIAELSQLRQASQIADLNIAAIEREKEIQVRTKNILLLIASMILVFLVVMLFLYLGRRKKHRQLEVAYHELDEIKNELEAAETKISKLLQQQVSPEIANALIDEKSERTKQFVAVMFLDIRGFTPIAEKMEPKELIDYQNKVFGFMIEIIERHHGNINQFMGDGFMATFGAPVSHGNDVRNAYLAGREILQGIKELNSKDQDLPETTLGIGIHAGDVVTGNVGTETRKQFSVTGNTVILAARVEQLNKTYSSSMIITKEVHAALDSGDIDTSKFSVEETQVKGRSEKIKIYVLQQPS